MKRAVFCGLAALCLAGFASAGPAASGFITWTPNGSNFDYDIHLNNIGTTGIQTLWYSWIPGQDYMPVAPITTGAPTGWVQNLVSHGASDGYAIRWQTTTTPLAAGDSLDGFTFTSSLSPTTLAGNTPFFTNPPMGTTFVYSGTSIVPANGFQFVVNPVPEPATIAGLVLGLPMLLRRRKRSR